jgi:Family of unknown function (DUF5703)
MAEYSYLVLNLPRGTSTDLARRILTDHAEYGHWELAKLRVFADGSRTATLRRKIIRPRQATGQNGLPPMAAPPGQFWRP